MQETVQSVDRTLSILEVLSDYENGLGIKELSEKVELHKSTVHRLLATLIQKGYVEQSASTDKYKLTLKLFELGSKKIDKMNIVTAARPLIHELMERTNEVVHLVVREGTDIVYISKMEPENTIRMYSRLGNRNPMYCTAAGKSMLSYLKSEEVDKIWKISDVQKYTRYTIVDLDEFKKYLNSVKEKGYAVDEQEKELGIRCIGTVIFNYNGDVCGAISISGSILSFTEDKIESYSVLLKEYANKISKELGYRK